VATFCTVSEVSTGGGGVTPADVAAAVWDEPLSSHNSSWMAGRTLTDTAKTSKLTKTLILSE
jgi:hypothetical protein